jgi:hydrocephalus-inducing protein
MNVTFAISNPKLFTVLPASGSIAPSEKPQPITVIFKSSEEVTLQNSTEIYCQIADPHTNQLIAKIPVPVSVRCFFSKYSINPERGINFGPFLVGTKKSRTFTIKNEGEFEFKFNLSKMGFVDEPIVSTPPATTESGGSTERAVPRVGARRSRASRVNIILLP